MQSLDEFQQQLRSGQLKGARQIKLYAGLEQFPAELFELADSLEILDLSNNQLSQLPEDLWRFHKLRILFASNNPFAELPAVLGRCPQLEMLGFKACRIAHVPAQSLPPRLRWLILTDNQLGELPEELGQCTRLQKLMLSCNQLTALPGSLAHCRQLELLRIASNRFTQLPEVIWQLPQLAWLAMAGNPMTQKSELLEPVNRAQKAIFYQNLQLHEELGQGASGHIYRATLQGSHQPHQSIAVKVFKAAHTSDGTPQSELAAGLAAGQHPHLLTPLAAVTGHPQQQLAMALPLLASELQVLAGPPSFDSCTRDVYAAGALFTSAAAEKLLHSVRSALAHLHGLGIVHGDLYAHNILWNPATGDAVLSDLGAACLTHELPQKQMAQLQQIELRALRHLEEEIQARIY